MTGLNSTEVAQQGQVPEVRDETSQRRGDRENYWSSVTGTWGLSFIICCAAPGTLYL